MLIYRFPTFFYTYKLFEPVIGFYSIGDLILDSVIALFILFYIGKNFSYNAIRLDRKNIVFDFVAFILVNALLISALFFLYDLFVQFIITSEFSFEVYSILKLSFESVTALLAFGFAFMILFYVYAEVLRIFNRYLRLSRLLIVTVLVYALIFVINYLFGGFTVWDKLWILAAVAVLTLVGAREEMSFSYVLLIIALLASLIVSDIVIVADNHKFDSTARKLAKKVQNMRDPIAEQLLYDISEKIVQDDVLKVYLSKPASLRLQQKIAHYLYKEYFQGYWKKYDLNVILCSNSFELPQNQMRQICANRYGDLVIHYGQKLNDNVSFISDRNGTIVYLLVVHAPDNDLYIELRPKIVSRKIGYPELLLDTKASRQVVRQVKAARWNFRITGARFTFHGRNFKPDLMSRSKAWPSGCDSTGLPDNRPLPRYMESAKTRLACFRAGTGTRWR
jgi:hypothetical protein